MLAVAAVLLVLALVAGLGTYNYLRNAAAEEEIFRPYRGVSDEELEELAAAYSEAVETANARYEAARGRGGGVRERHLLGQRVSEYERQRRRSARVRNLGGNAAELEASLRAVEEEVRYREANRDPWKRVLRLALTF